jgi:hypothetical protein
VLVEVLSETTEAYERGAKAAHYRRLASLMLEARAGEVVDVPSLGVRLDAGAVYANPLGANH